MSNGEKEANAKKSKEASEKKRATQAIAEAQIDVGKRMQDRGEQALSS